MRKQILVEQPIRAIFFCPSKCEIVLALWQAVHVLRLREEKAHTDRCSEVYVVVQAKLAMLQHQEPLRGERVVVHTVSDISQHLVYTVFIELGLYHGWVHRLFGVLKEI